MTDRVSIPCRIGIFRQRSPVGPDRTPFVFALEELQHAAGSLNELNRRGHEHDARETNRIALQDWIISAGSRSRSVSGNFFYEPRLCPRRHGRKIFFVGEIFCAAGALILPNAGQITLRRGCSLGLCGRLFLGRLSEYCGRESQDYHQRLNPAHPAIPHSEPPEIADRNPILISVAPAFRRACPCIIQCRPEGRH